MLTKYLIFFYLLFLLPASALVAQDNVKSTKSHGFIKKSDPIDFVKVKGVILELKVLLKLKEQLKGLSGVKKGELKTNQGALFLYPEEGDRSFWMPNTYFDLAIIFLDKNFKITHLEKQAKAHPGTEEPPIIYRTKSAKAKYVIEVAASKICLFER